MLYKPTGTGFDSSIPLESLGSKDSGTGDNIIRLAVAKYNQRRSRGEKWIIRAKMVEWLLI